MDENCIFIILFKGKKYLSLGISKPPRFGGLHVNASNSIIDFLIYQTIIFGHYINGNGTIKAFNRE